MTRDCTKLMSLAFTITKTTSPRIALSAILTLGDFSATDISKNEDSYIEAGEVTSRDKNYNLLRALQHDIYLRQEPPRLSAASVSAMPSSIDTNVRKTKVSGRRYFPITSAITLQVRSFNFPSTSRILLSVDIESTDFLKTTIDIDSIDVEVQATTIKPIVKVSFPIRLRSKDLFTYGFDLDCAKLASDLESEVPILIKVLSRPMIYVHDAVSGPALLSKWNTAIPLSAMATKNSNSTGTVSTHPRVRRSTSNMHLRSIGGPLSPRDAPPVSSLAGTVVTIVPPPSGEVGQLIRVAIVVRNQSTTVKNLSIDVSRRRKDLPPIPEAVSRDAAAAIAAPAASPHASAAAAAATASFPLSDDALLQLHQSLTVEPADLICLTNSIKVGFLAPDAQADLSLQYVALKRGLLRLQDLRVVELGSGIYQELNDLPEIWIK